MARATDAQADRAAVAFLILQTSERDDHVVSKNTNELKTGAPGRFDRHRPVASLRSGACRRRCRRFGFPRPVPKLGPLVLPLLSVGEMTLRLYAALNYSQNRAKIALTTFAVR